MRKVIDMARILTVTLVCALGLPSCIYDNYADGEGADKDAILHLRIGSVGISRAGEASEIELMHTLRFIIVNDAGEVELNIHRNTIDGKSFIYRCRITPGHKKVFLIANEESVNDESGTPLASILNGFGEGAKEIEKRLERFVFTPDYSKNIPMSSMYEIDITPGENEEQFYVVRVATKFDVKIINNRSDEVRVDNFTVSSLADKSYLLPDFTADDAGIWTEGERHPFIFNDDFSFNDGDEAMHWADWLKLASEESDKDITDDTLADRRGWIMEYGLPGSATHSICEWETSEIPTAASFKTIEFPTHYHAESKRMKAGDSIFAPGQEQEYEFKIEFSSRKEGEDWAKSPEFTKVFPNLRALFRNTHVLLNITLSDSGVKWRIFVKPWNLRVQPEIIM